MTNTREIANFDKVYGWIYEGEIANPQTRKMISAVYAHSDIFEMVVKASHAGDAIPERIIGRHDIDVCKVLGVARKSVDWWVVGQWAGFVSALSVEGVDVIKTGQSATDERMNIGDTVTRDAFNYALDVLPPASFSSHHVQVGEPCDHMGNEGRARFTTYVKQGEECFYVGKRIKGDIPKVIESPEIDDDDNSHLIEVLVGGQFSYHWQIFDVLRWLSKYHKFAYALIRKEFPHEFVFEGSWFDTEAMGVDADWPSWLCEAIENTGIVQWHDGEPWAVKL